MQCIRTRKVLILFESTFIKCAQCVLLIIVCVCAQKQLNSSENKFIFAQNNSKQKQLVYRRAKQKKIINIRYALVILLLLHQAHTFTFYVMPYMRKSRPKEFCHALHHASANCYIRKYRK